VANYHHGNLRASLIDEAIHQLQDQIEGELSLRQLAIATGVSNNAPYRHFKNKQALLDSIAEEGFRRLCNYLESVCCKRDGIEKVAQAYLTFVDQNPKLYRQMFNSPAEENLQQVQAAQANCVAGLAEILACQYPSLAEDCRALAATSILSYLHGVASLHPLHTSPPLPGEGEQLRPLYGLIECFLSEVEPA